MTTLQYYSLSIILGFMVVYLFRPRVKKFSWREYVTLFMGPLIGLILVIRNLGYLPLYIFILGALGLTLTEWMVGFIYNKIMGSHLWIYERYSFPGRYTSLLSMPIWGFGAVLLWLIFRII